jgi:SAM-dependent methyltransferase
MTMDDRIEILSVDLLEKQNNLVRVFRHRAEKLGIQLGWHYPLDLAWIGSQLGEVRGRRILDAGAGTGVLQWWLAEQGADVVSVDRADRSDLSCRFRMAYRVRGVNPQDLYPTWRLVFQRLADRRHPLKVRLMGMARAALTIFVEIISPKAQGEVVIYRQDLSDLTDLKDGSFDAVVSVSAVEHNPPDKLKDVVDELTRVLKPGGMLLATLAAAKDQDWYHEPSKGWCYTEGSLRRAFSLSASVYSNYQNHDALFARLRENKELRENLAPMFFQSGDNGMPWGIWDPKYQPVGVRKMKSNRGRLSLKREKHEQP